MDITGIMNPIAAEDCIVNPHKSKAIVAILTPIVLQKPHFRFVRRPIVAISPKTPKDKNMRKSIREVA